MALGNDATACTEELSSAMRARLEAQQKGLGANVDLDAVKANLAALGLAVFRIATARAETSSDTASDSVFWAWTAGVNNYLRAVQQWQSGITQAIQSWSPTTVPEQQLRAKIVALPVPPAPPAAPPSALKGRIR